MTSYDITLPIRVVCRPFNPLTEDHPQAGEPIWEAHVLVDRDALLHDNTSWGGLCFGSNTKSAPAAIQDALKHFFAISKIEESPWSVDDLLQLPKTTAKEVDKVHEAYERGHRAQKGWSMDAETCAILMRVINSNYSHYHADQIPENRHHARAVATEILRLKGYDRKPTYQKAEEDALLIMGQTNA